MNKIKAWIRGHWLTIAYWLIAALFALLLLVAWASNRSPVTDSDSDRGTAWGDCAEACSICQQDPENNPGACDECRECSAPVEGLEGCHVSTCPKCEHAAKQCKCGNDPFKQAYWCNIAKGCEIGCSSLEDGSGTQVPPPTSEALYGASGGLTGQSDVDCQLVRGQADILGSNMAEEYSDTDALERDTKLLQEILTDCGCASAGVGYDGSDVKCPCNVCPWNCL